MQHNYEFVNMADLEEDTEKSYAQRRQDLLNEVECLDQDCYDQLTDDFQRFQEEMVEKYKKRVELTMVSRDEFYAEIVKDQNDDVKLDVPITTFSLYYRDMDNNDNKKQKTKH